MVGHGHGIGHSLEVVETVLEVADAAWTAIDHHRHHRAGDGRGLSSEGEISSLEAENHRLRTQLQKNLNLLQTLAQSSALSKDCPPDLYQRLIATVDSSSFLTQLESINQPSTVTPNSNFPFKEATEHETRRTAKELYRHRAIVKVAAKGIGATGKIIMKAL